MGIFSLLRRKTKQKSVFLGLDNSGKSTIISFLKEGKFVEHTPTMGKDLQKLEIDGTRFLLFDMGGQSHFRKMWTGEMKDSKCVVFVIDAADPDRFNESKSELQKVLPLIAGKDMKLLILANKSDKRNAIPLDQLIDIFELSNLPNFEIMSISAKTGLNMADAFVKFYSLLTGKMLKKNTVTQAISIFDPSGLPIITRSKSDHDDRDILEGGFITAITHFGKMKNNANCIKFESENDGVYVIKRTENYIGALLWDENLDIPIDDTESALDDLLNHLESSLKFKDHEEVAYYVSQYCTNMI
ncbi:GTPase Der [Candidatus Lokiarchaeum ossiferum]|uniref:GTPase Der n=1 Tax=Candidatus Lokiarchaeum ossiferum TaxID=2951803 RepID=A0ABY6I0A6_9ARCH|nr:GTPase Der [Candidatus Lokiarchaeum sp. B-35]